MHLHLGPRGGRWGGEKESERGAQGPCPARWQQRTKLSGVSPKTAQGPLACDPAMVESITASSPQPQPRWLVARIGPMSVNSFVFRGTDFRAPSGGGRFPARRGRHPRGRVDLIPLIYTLLKPLAPAISPGHEPRRKDQGQDQQRSRLLQSSTRWAEGTGKVNRLPINPAAPSELLRARETGAASAQCGPVTAGLHDFLLDLHTWAPPRKPLKGPLGAHGRWGEGTLRSLGTSAELGGEAKSLDHQVQNRSSTELPSACGCPSGGGRGYGSQGGDCRIGACLTASRGTPLLPFGEAEERPKQKSFGGRTLGLSEARPEDAGGSGPSPSSC